MKKQAAVASSQNTPEQGVWFFVACLCGWVAGTAVRCKIAVINRRASCAGRPRLTCATTMQSSKRVKKRSGHDLPVLLANVNDHGAECDGQEPPWLMPGPFTFASKSTQHHGAECDGQEPPWLMPGPRPRRVSATGAKRGSQPRSVCASTWATQPTKVAGPRWTRRTDRSWSVPPRSTASASSPSCVCYICVC